MNAPFKQEAFKLGKAKIYMHPTEQVLMIDAEGLKAAQRVNQVRHGRLLGQHWWQFVFLFFSYTTTLGKDEGNSLKTWLERNNIEITR